VQVIDVVFKAAGLSEEQDAETPWYPWYMAICDGLEKSFLYCQSDIKVSTERKLTRFACAIAPDENVVATLFQMELCM